MHENETGSLELPFDLSPNSTFLIFEYILILMALKYSELVQYISFTLWFLGHHLSPKANRLIESALIMPMSLGTHILSSKNFASAYTPVTSCASFAATSNSL